MNIQETLRALTADTNPETIARHEAALLRANKGAYGIYEEAKDTAKKIRAALKKAFKGVKFSVRTRKSTRHEAIDVRWTDGPMRRDVESVVEVFRSRSRVKKTDFPGYWMNGKLYVGTEYISSTRVISEDNRALIRSTLIRIHNRTIDDCYFDRAEWEDAERRLRDIGMIV